MNPFKKYKKHKNKLIVEWAELQHKQMISEFPEYADEEKLEEFFDQAVKAIERYGKWQNEDMSALVDIRNFRKMKDLIRLQALEESIKPQTTDPNGCYTR